MLEAALSPPQQPLTVDDLRKMFVEEIGPDVVRKLLDELRARNGPRASGRTDPDGERMALPYAPEYLPYLGRLNRRKPPPKYSRAVLETLAIIAYGSR